MYCFLYMNVSIDVGLTLSMLTALASQSMRFVYPSFLLVFDLRVVFSSLSGSLVIMLDMVAG